jgi:glycosyltransferase involved in cell wall biosynthesis
MISVLTVSKRTGWEQLAVDSLNKQTYQDFEWIIVPEVVYTFPKTLKHGNHVMHVMPPLKKEGNFSNLSASNNTGLRHCKGDYVVFYQDFIELDPDCLEKLVALADPKTFVTTLTRNPDGGEEDPRYTWQDEVRACYPEEWEENVGMAPVTILRELGGYDQRYDAGWAWNNCNVAQRAEMLGCKFLLDETNRPQLIYHKKEPDLNPDMPLNRDLHDKTMLDIIEGRQPLRLNYL